jgi:hypothetical protein
MNTETNKNTQQIMKEIEKKTEAYVITNMSSLTSEKLVNIMSKGSEEFKQKTGRDMTYSEMRQMYG